MADKKKVQVLVDSSDSAPVTGSAFNFAAFQQQFSEDTGGASVAPRGGSGTGEQADASYHTAYQCRKSSIVAGMTSEQLVDDHRKSIAGIAVKEMGRAIDMGDLHGITLSKRHTLAQLEYEAELDAGSYKNFDGFRFGEQCSAEDAAAESKPPA